jgi:hypothetical protein
MSGKLSDALVQVLLGVSTSDIFKGRREGPAG